MAIRVAFHYRRARAELQSIALFAGVRRLAGPQSHAKLELAVGAGLAVPRPLRGRTLVRLNVGTKLLQSLVYEHNGTRKRVRLVQSGRLLYIARHGARKIPKRCVDRPEGGCGVEPKDKHLGLRKLRIDRLRMSHKVREAHACPVSTHASWQKRTIFGTVALPPVLEAFVAAACSCIEHVVQILHVDLRRRACLEGALPLITYALDAVSQGFVNLVLRMREGVLWKR